MSCLDLEDVAPSKKQIMASRSFGAMAHNIDELREAVSWHVGRATEKLRAQHEVAGAVYVFVQTNRFKEHEQQYNGSVIVPLADVSDDSMVLTASALMAERWVQVLHQYIFLFFAFLKQPD